MIIKIAAIIIVLLAMWSLWGYFTSRVEQAEYIVVQKTADYEIREYPARIVAQTTVKGPYEKALNQGFRIVAGYIFGGNAKKQSIAMTAPVTSQSKTAEQIAMTAPVIATVQGNSHIISFGMPRSYTIEELPKPLDPRVEIVQVPPKRFAVLRFSWGSSYARVQKMETKLLAALERDKVAVTGSPVYAGYNAPWTPPWMVRNEVMAEIRSSNK